MSSMNKHMFSSISLIAALAGLIACSSSATSCSSPEYLTYEKFGAKGDGVTDDFPAIIATHEAANEQGLPVKATDGKTYYIGNTIGTAIVRTDVDFGTAKFIIDDSNVSVEDRGKNIFQIESSLEPITVEGIGALKRDQKNIGKTFPGRCLVEVVNDNQKVYIRYGLNQNNGTGQKEFFIVDKDGNIDPSTALVWDYAGVTKMVAYPIDEKQLVVKGGIFTTIANQAPSKYTYYGRGIAVRRSNVRIENVKHYVEGELDHGAPYSGFMAFNTVADIVVSNCLYTAHKTYVTIGSAGKPVSMGSYDIGANGCVNAVWENCNQTTDINDNKYWGLFGSNFCKALTMDNVAFSRFDAHQGVRNVNLKNSKFGYMGVQMVGFGTMLIDNCEIHRSSVVALRSDYGSSWEGELIVKNCKLIVPKGSKEVTLLSGSNTGKHDFGYTCYLPERYDIENLVIDDSAVTDKNYKGPNIFGTFNRNVKDKDLIPYIAKGVVNLKNVTVASGKPLGVSLNPDMFKDYTINISE